MPERLNSHKKNTEEDSSLQRFPTEAELRAFEEERDRRGTRFGQLSEPETIESFARDPQNPTPEELKFMDDFNAMTAGEPLSFEDYFGYPDPRKQPNDAAELHQTEVSESEEPK